MAAYAPATVLTIEDDETVRRSIVAYLEDRGFKALEAGTGRAGLEAFRGEHPDVVLVDLRMPDVDGYTVLETVAHESPNTPTIVISGTGVVADAVEALHCGAWDYVLKPIEDMAVLSRAIERVSERASLICEMKQSRRAVRSRGQADDHQAPCHRSHHRR